MSLTQPIRSKKDLKRFTDYYKTAEPNLRNYTIISMGLYTALRISDVLNLRCKDVYKNGKVKKHICVREQKTGKENTIYVNSALRAVLAEYRKSLEENKMHLNGNPYLFPSPRDKNKHLSRFTAYRVIRKAANAVELEGHISCHSLRKTFGYFACKQGHNPSVMVDIYNHSSYDITKRYLCIDQDEKDTVFRKICLT